MACSPPRTKWRRVGEEPRGLDSNNETRATGHRRHAEERGSEYPGGTSIIAQSPGGTDDGKPAAISAMWKKMGEKNVRDTQAHKTGGTRGTGATKVTQQAYNRQDTLALWETGEMGRSQPVKSHAGRVIDLQWDKQGTDIDLEDIGPPESVEETGMAWWATAPPQFTPDSLEWSEDDEEWLPVSGKSQGKSKGVGRTPGVRPIRSYSRKDREHKGKSDSSRVETPAHTVTAESESGERLGEGRGRWRPGAHGRK